MIPEVRDLVADEALSVQRSLQEQIKVMVQGEMKDIRKSIDDLMQVVKDLSQNVNGGKQDFNSSCSRFDKATANDANRPQIIEVTQINPPSVDLNAIPTQYQTNPILSESIQNRTPMSAMSSLPTLPPRTNFSNFISGQNPNKNSIPHATTNNQNNPYCSVNNGNLPYNENLNTNAGYPFDSYNNRNNPPNTAIPRDMMPRIWIRIDKWGLNFDGNNLRMSVEDFIFRLERLQAQYDIPLEELERDFHLLLSGPAKDWYWLFVQTNVGVKWPGLKQALLNQYQTSRSNCEIIRDLVERRQNPNETIDQYFQAMNQIRARLVQGITEHDMLKILKRNVRESIGRIVFPIAVSSVEQLRIECNEAERTFLRKDVRNIQPQPRNMRVNEVYFDQNIYIPVEESASDEVGEVSALQMNRPLLVCWNCKVPGHTFMDCPSTERSVFCYRCGRPNVITPNCPHCQGNLKQGVGVSGDQRPLTIPRKEI